MPNKKTLVPFAGTAEQEAKLREAIAQHKGEPGATMPIMQEAQEIYGYLPEEVQMIIADELGIPLSEVYGISSFYAQFTHNPKGKIQVSICLGTACYVKGAQQIIDKFSEILGIKAGQTTADGLFTIDALRCIGACGIAPAVSINGKVYPKMTVDKVAAVVEEYRAMGGNNG